MKPTNGKASTIMIRDLSKNDNIMLKQLKAEFSTEFNTVAMMKAAAGFLNQKKELTKMEEQMRFLKNEIESLNSSLSALKTTVTGYFQFQSDTAIKQAEITQTLKGMVAPVGLVKAPVRAKNKRQSINELLS